MQLRNEESEQVQGNGVAAGADGEEDGEGGVGEIAYPTPLG